MTVSTILISSGSSQSILRVILTLFSLMLLLSIHRYSLFINFTLVFIALIAIQQWLVPITDGLLQFILLGIVGIFMNILPGFIVGFFTLFSTKVSEFIAAMEKLKLPRTVIIPISVIFRFFPTIAEEYQHISHAMKLRGITFTRHFTKLIEYRVIPLIISVVQIGNDLSFTAMTRGIDAPNQRTNVCVVKLGWLDKLLMLIMLILWVIYFKEKFFQ
ncbi:energy-coupling factor transporter transmembrane protein EcfT [Staphylococcus auricularis]|nr:energy-coupling factor transporter transmembrane protein EcfT [Staphylococcus auricularis]PNZ68183.1 energy-coupling factor transporter transmembrane protein EcfT [Staphylococcus auricularis]PTH24727.1 energy-coupling factor transporter transmembrane protein EcfT [Staphylococcus auricularis]QPT07064.1 energy-coupling factor transporter transmembrane protein EcfT [Staphylococcus auricularis]